MKKIFSLFLVFFLAINWLFAGITLCSWNLLDFGKTKSSAEIEFIANTLKNYDVVAIQEVVAHDPGGAQAVARLAEALNRKGAKWDYVISDITSSSSYKAERYAFIWKTSKLSILGKPWLEKIYNLEIDREPFFATFKSGDKFFTVVNFHAITKSKQPETEIKYFKLLPAEYPDKNLIFCGDFNLPESHTVFNPLKAMGYKPIFTDQKTTLKEECNGDICLASETDNIFYDSDKISFIKSGIIAFYNSFSSLSEARKISDHVPVFFEFGVK
jgi:deoxyribonuclease-1-like protein